MALKKVKAIEFVRLDEDNFVCRFLGETKDDIIMTMEPRTIFPDSTYILKLGSTLVIRDYDYHYPFDEEDRFDRYFNEL